MDRMPQVIKSMTTVFLAEYLKDGHINPEASDINGGDCALFALCIKQLIPSVKLAYTIWNGHHAFVFYQGKYYDSEHPKGVQDWRRLKATRGFYKLSKDQIESPTLEQFMVYWKLSVNKTTKYVRSVQ